MRRCRSINLLRGRPSILTYSSWFSCFQSVSTTASPISQTKIFSSFCMACWASTLQWVSDLFFPHVFNLTDLVCYLVNWSFSFIHYVCWIRNGVVFITCCHVQGVMVRLMLVLAPVMCILSGIAVSSLLNIYMPQVDHDSSAKSTSSVDKKKNKQDGNFIMKGQVKINILENVFFLSDTTKPHISHIYYDFFLVFSFVYFNYY